MFRFDLLKLKFNSLSPVARSVHVEAAERVSADLARARSAADGGSEAMPADGTKTVALLTLPATAGAEAMSPGISPNLTARATLGSPANAGAAATSATMTFADLASGAQKMFKLVSDGMLGNGSYAVAACWKTFRQAVASAANLMQALRLGRMPREITCGLSSQRCLDCATPAC